ncbi:magnesium chelatase family protein [Microcella putealis]|uniref:Magnesium chelatase family protein n=1 Tax=Microcella putealis TaxID=337005 RepID=A0A4Q7LRT6_9MICO|nr:YifB family Mg chelatase-like AAA ATPase [Microcella putealis]RZS57575.1 magnesium chelatase family protein [Microcella putealis]TQM24642.1 magnesium chelatase family protein [Microcella putealis]
MPVVSTRAIALNGVDGALVHIEADLSSGLPGFSIIGLPDAALGEAKDRVRSAALNSGVELPARRVTVNLSPAAVPKHGSGFDLGIAVAALASGGTVPAHSVGDTVHLGELGLDGRLRPVHGVLPAVLAAKRSGARRVIVPTGNVDEASLVSGIDVVGLPSLREVLIRHGAELDAEPCEPVMRPGSGGGAAAGDATSSADLADVVGHPDAIDALVTAAAGGHHVMMLGPPGAGKTMLASRLPAILPDLDAEAAIEVSSVRSLCGEPVDALITRPPFEAPHHSATMASLVGGGSGLVRPGAISRAAHGVLFLDEAPEFSATVLDALRQPLETGWITIHRARTVARFPAQCQLVLAANPCPCGNAGTIDGDCTCTPIMRRRYLGRLSGPLLDRIDVHLGVRRVSTAHLIGSSRGERTTADARAAVVAARDVAAERWAAHGHRLNAQVPGAVLRAAPWRLPATARAPLDRALERGALTMRGYDRVLRLAWTVADLAGAATPSLEHVGAALYLRKGVQ